MHGVGAKLVGVLALTVVASAARGEMRQGEQVLVRQDEVIEGDLYVFGSEIDVRGTVTGDLVAFGQQLDVGGRVQGDVLATGGRVSIPGQVGGSARVAAGELTLTGNVREDVVVAAGRSDLTRNGRVGRDVLISGGNVTLASPVSGSVWAAAGSLVLAGPVGGDVRARAGELRLAEGARIEGDLLYRSQQELERHPSAQVLGTVQGEAGPGRRAVAVWFVRWIRLLIGLFALGILFALVFPRFERQAESELERSPWKSLGIGLAVLVAVPIAAFAVVLIGALVGGWWLGLFGLVAYALAICVAVTLVGLFIGHFIFRRLGKGAIGPALALLVGLALVTLLWQVPILGAIAVAATILFGLGALARAAARPKERPPAAAPA